MWESAGRFHAVMAAELELLDPDVRRDAQRVRSLLHPDFAEIGRSGRRWTRADTIAALEQEQDRVAADTDEWMFNEVAPSLVLVTYRISTPAGSSRHTSLWDVSGSAPVIRYHQGTALTSGADGQHNGGMTENRSRALGIRSRSERDVQEVVNWVPDAETLHLFSGPRLTWPLAAAQLHDMTALEGLTAWSVVSDDGHLVGHFDLTIDGPVARLGRVIIDPALRGQGFAIEIVELAKVQAQRLGAEIVRLNVISTNQPAIRAYRRAGFRTAEESGRVGVLVMELRLPPLAS